MREVHPRRSGVASLAAVDPPDNHRHFPRLRLASLATVDPSPTNPGTQGGVWGDPRLGLASLAAAGPRRTHPEALSLPTRDAERIPPPLAPLLQPTASHERRTPPALQGRSRRGSRGPPARAMPGRVPHHPHLGRNSHRPPTDHPQTILDPLFPPRLYGGHRPRRAFRKSPRGFPGVIR